MGRRHPLRITAWASAALLAAFALAGPAGARKFQMSGDWVIRRGPVFWPLQFAATAMGTGMQVTHVSMGNLTFAFGFPNGPIPGAGGVTATGSAPAGLRVPRHRFVADPGAVVPFDWGQLATMLAFDGPAAAASLAANDGPGSFTWCPGDLACAAGGGMLSTDPPQGAGARNGRVLYRAGANRFGGAMRVLLQGRSVRSTLYASDPQFQFVHWFLGPMGTQATGGSYANARTNVQTDGFVTQPSTFMTGHPIAISGPKLTTMGGLTNTGTGPTLTFPGSTTMDTGFPFTTGTVFVQQTAGSAADFFTVMGSDMRTALGAGNIAVVAGGVSLRSGYYPTTEASFQRVRMTLGAPIPSLSPAGFVAAGALVLLAAGWAMRRRL